MRNQENILTPDKQIEDQETNVRPSSIHEFIGQNKMKNNLEIFIESARTRKESLDHVLLHGPPGLGKTTIASIIARELSVNLRATSGPILSKAGDVAAILTNLEENDVLFIDEIHRLNIAVEEILYSAMEDYVIDILIGEGPAARTVRIDLPKFTLIGATTRLGLLSNPLKDRFGIALRLEFYEPKELLEVVKRGARVINFPIAEEGAFEIACRSRGTPRIALRLLRRVRDFAIASKMTEIDSEIADIALKTLGIDEDGLDSNDRRYINFINEHYAGGPVGIETIAAGLSEHKDSIEETIEPYLIQQGFLQRTSRGRVLAEKSLRKLT